MAGHVFTSMKQIMLNQRRRMSLAIVLGAAAAYELAFVPLYQMAGDVVAAFTVIPVAVAGWLLGVRAGLFAGLFWIPLNILNFTLVGQIGWEVVLRRWPAVLVSLAAGFVAGWAGERAAHAKRESREASYERDRFFDLSIDLLCIAGGDGYFKRLNPAWERVLGFSREELCSKPFIEFVHPDDRSRTQDVMEKLSRGQPAINFENRYRCQDGSYRWLTWITPAPEEGPPMFYAAARDITERKQIEEALRESEERYRLLADATFDGIAIHDQGLIFEVNSGLERMFGYGRGELIGKHVLDLVADESREMVIANMSKGGQGPYESVGRRKDGSTFYGEVVVKPYRYKGRDVRLVAGRDITERKQMEKALRRANDELEQRVAQRTQELLAANDALRVARARQRDLIEAIPGIVWECDVRTWKFSFVSHQAELVLGYPVWHWLDEPDFWQAHIHPDDRDWVMEYCLVSMRDKRKYSFEYRMLTADGRTVWLQDIVTVESDEQGPAILRGIMVDITERKQAEEALQQNEARLNAAQRIAQIGSWELDLVNNVLAWSDEIYRIFEIDSEKFGTSYAAFFELVHPDDRQFVNEAYTESVANRTCYNIEHRLLMSDGRVKFVHEQCETFYAPEGRPIRSIGTVQDITERKRVEEALREQLQLSSLSAQLHAALIQSDTLHVMLGNCADTLVRQLNLAFARIWLLDPGDLCDTCCKAAHCADRTRCLHLEASAGLSRNLNGEYRRIPLGALKIGWIAMGAGPMSTNDVLDDDRLPNKQWMKDNSLRSFAGYPLMAGHDIVGVMAVFGCSPLSKSTLDALETAAKAVTLGVVRRRTEEALKTSDQLLWAALEEREQLSQDLHDNIIQAVYAIGMSLEECRYLFQEDRAEAEKKLEHSVASLNRVISDVRTYIVWNKYKEITGQQLCAKLSELAVTMESTQGIHFSLDLAVEAAQRLTPLEAFHILHIVQEAMSNSLRHSKSQSGLVSLQMEGGRVRLEIRDDGVGFNLEEAVGQGHGLQNMTARAQKLGAHLQIVSKPGLGVQILVELPLEDQHAGASS